MSELLCVRCRACRQCSTHLSNMGYCAKCQETHDMIMRQPNHANGNSHPMFWRRPTKVINDTDYYMRFSSMSHLSARGQKEDLCPDEGDNH